MYVLNNYVDIKNKTPLCVALGTFDGVHMGHQKLIDVLRYNSKLLGYKSMIYTFSNHPRTITMPDKSTYNITNNSKRADIFEKLGIDFLFLEDFKTVMNMEAKSFVKDILVEKFNIKCVVVGYNYRFGHKGNGTSEDLKSYGDIYGFKTEVVPAVEINKSIVSSSLIRNLISSGEVEKVPLYLGRNFSLNGKVIYGKQNGTKMGIRTANMKLENCAILPSSGVYATDAIINGVMYKSVTNIGYNPTFNGNKLTVETHIIDFNEDVYDNSMEIYFLRKLRNEMKFKDIDSLIFQIKEDIYDRCNLLP